MRLRKGHEDAARAAAPHRVFWKACVLADDLAHGGISAAAREVEKSCGIGRKTLAIGSFAAGTAVAAAGLRSEPAIALPAAAFGAMAITVMWAVIKKAMDAAPSASAVAESLESAFLRLSRLPALAYGVWNLTASGERHHVSIGALFTGFGVAAYLASGGNGVLEKLGSMLGNLRRPEEARIPVRIDE